MAPSDLVKPGAGSAFHTQKAESCVRSRSFRPQPYHSNVNTVHKKWERIILQRTLKLGTAYHGNRILRHVEEDMTDIVNHHMNLVVHMYTHNDMDRHHNVLRDIIAVSEDKGLEVWVDNWGIDAGPGDKSYFTAACPEAKRVFSDGTPHRLRPCYNSPEFRAFTRQWIEYVGEAGGKTIFWDEPHLDVDKRGYTCCCPRCRAMFAERYGHEMPAELTPEVAAFRTDTIVNYFQEMTDYAHDSGMTNTGCIMFNPEHGISLDSIGRLLSLEHFDNVGCDPYWIGRNADPSPDFVYDYVYDRSKRALDMCTKYKKDHNLWIQAYDIPSGRENELLVAAEAAYDAGARTILTWSFRGGEPNDYRCENCDMVWDVTGEAMLRLRLRHYNDLMASIHGQKRGRHGAAQ